MAQFNEFERIYSTYIGPVIDIVILALLLYSIYKLVIKTNASQIFRVIGSVVIFYVLISVLNLSTLKWLLDKITLFLIICVAIIFQPELRKIFLRLGQQAFFSIGTRTRHNNIDSVILAAETLSGERRGMLVVFVRYDDMKDIIGSGTRIQAELSSDLLVTIFEYDTPLHDGAVIVQNGKIVAAGCVLPLSESPGLDKSFGTRHRAALGMSEQSDAVVLVVSEERGTMSLACDGKFLYDLSSKEITEMLEEKLDLSAQVVSTKEEEEE